MIISFLFIISFGFVSPTFFGEFEPYTKVARTIYGLPCLGGCSPTTNKCIYNWLKLQSPCRTDNEPAPIYFTTQAIDKKNKYCLSNCGYFGNIYEWCFTTSDFKWDYCSSKVRSVAGEARSQIDAYTKECKLCESPCSMSNCTSYYWCYTGLNLWSYCAPPAISRVPVLPTSYNSGKFNKGQCNAFIRSIIPYKVTLNIDAVEAYDDFVKEMADAIEAGAKVSNYIGAGVFETKSNLAIKSYTMVNVILANGTNVVTPAVLRARITKDTLRVSAPLIDVRGDFERMEDSSGLYESYYYKRLISFEIGGQDEVYNYVPQSAKLSETWSHIKEALGTWCSNVGGSVDVVMVVFYPDTHTTVPRAVGVSMTFLNPDGSVFVDCKDTIYWNNL